jgi:hypothetical protein
MVDQYPTTILASESHVGKRRVHLIKARQPRLSKDYERKVQTSEMLLQLAMIRLMVRRLARSIG